MAAPGPGSDGAVAFGAASQALPGAMLRLLPARTAHHIKRAIGERWDEYAFGAASQVLLGTALRLLISRCVLTKNIFKHLCTHKVHS
jgi:hypothetical protein